MLLQSKDVNTKHAGIFHHYSFPFSSQAIQATNIRKSKCLFYSRDIFFFLGNGSKMLIETFSRGGILKMPPSSAEVGRNSIPSVIVSLGIPEGREKRTRFKMMTPMREFEGGGGGEAEVKFR